MTDYDSDICSHCGNTLTSARFHLWGRGPLHEHCYSIIHEGLMRATKGLTLPADVPEGAVARLVGAARESLRLEAMLGLNEGPNQKALRAALAALGMGDGR